MQTPGALVASLIVAFVVLSVLVDSGASTRHIAYRHGELASI